MAGYLLDTHTALWYFSGDEKLSKTANEIIYNSSNPIKTSHLIALEALPLIHRDPFDRLLVATAIASIGKSQ